MKRSIMLDYIGEYLATDGVVLSSAMSLGDIAEDLLSLIEEGGMLPPCLNLSSGGDFTKQNCQEMVDDYEGHFEWEEISYGE